tara:strand:+ start:915 stop:1112 length:198 start_codon:yes stop_codon:yes gene_type:complete
MDKLTNNFFLAPQVYLNSNRKYKTYSIINAVTNEYKLIKNRNKVYCDNNCNMAKKMHRDYFVVAS